MCIPLDFFPFFVVFMQHDHLLCFNLVVVSMKSKGPITAEGHNDEVLVISNENCSTSAHVEVQVEQYNDDNVDVSIHAHV